MCFDKYIENVKNIVLVYSIRIIVKNMGLNEPQCDVVG